MLPPTLTPHAEKRRTLRARRLRKARCVFNDGASSFDVILRDISPSGARIAAESLYGLPATFEFQVHDGFGGYASRRARLVWANGSSAGIEFID